MRKRQTSRLGIFPLNQIESTIISDVNHPKGGFKQYNSATNHTRKLFMETYRICLCDHLPIILDHCCYVFTVIFMIFTCILKWIHFCKIQMEWILLTSCSKCFGKEEIKHDCNSYVVSWLILCDGNINKNCFRKKIASLSRIYESVSHLSILTKILSNLIGEMNFVYWGTRYFPMVT